MVGPSPTHGWYNMEYRSTPIAQTKIEAMKMADAGPQRAHAQI